MENAILYRLTEGLDASEVKIGRGRVKEVAEKTGYSTGMVSRILAGKVEPADKFIFAVCAAFDISINWVVTGAEPVLTPAGRIKHDPSFFMDNREVDTEKIDREVFGIVSEERKDKERFIMGLVRRLPDDELQPVEDYIFERVKTHK